MGRRSALCLVSAAAVLLLVLFPAVAVAGGPWTVNDALGQKIGTVRTTSSTTASVSRDGHGVGHVYKTSRGWWTAMGYLPEYNKAIHIRHAALWGGQPAWQFRGFSKKTPLPLIGRLFKQDGRWIAQAGNSHSGWWTRGSVDDACPPWAAGGGVFLLDSHGF